AYASLAFEWMAQGDYDAAIDCARQAQAMAEQLGVPEVRSEALNTAGSAAAETGGDWIGPLGQSLEIAVAGGFEAQAGRAFTNIYGNFVGLRRFAEGERFYVDGVAYCDGHDVGTFGNCIRGTRTIALE